jgi:hypothetical protein
MRTSIAIFCVSCFYMSFSLPAKASQSVKSNPESPCVFHMLAKLPIGFSDDPIDERPRFELLQCGSNEIIVEAYEKNQTAPSLSYDTGDSYPSYMAYIFNVLVFQFVGGSSDHAYVFVFHKGKPSLALKTATKGLIQVTQSDRAITVIVPPVTYPDNNGEFPPEPAPQKYTFAIEMR